MTHYTCVFKGQLNFSLNILKFDCLQNQCNGLKQEKFKPRAMYFTVYRKLQKHFNLVFQLEKLN